MFLNNKYTKWYFQIIYRANGISRSRGDSEYFEEHHIIPDSLDGSNSKWNLVYLTAREHFIAHWLLTKCLEGEAKSKMICAFWMLANTRSGQRNYSSRYYEIARKKFSEERTLNLPKGEIIDLYINQRWTTYQIAKEFNCCDGTIGKLLKGDNIKIRTSSESLIGILKGSKLDQFNDKIIDLYEQGFSALKIAEKFNCSKTPIINLLKNNSVKIRSAAKYQKNSIKYSKLIQYTENIIDLYLNRKLNTYQIAKKFNCSHVSIGNILKKNNIKIRSLSEAKIGKEYGSKLDQYKDEIIDLYNNKKLSTYEIANKFDCSRVSIGNLLKKNNVKIRKR